MVNWLRTQLENLRAGLSTGLGLGLGYIFLTLIGIPSRDSVALSRIAVEIFLFMAFIFGWQIARRIPQAEIDKIFLNSAALGIVAAFIFLLFMGQLNRWQASGVDVVGLYFNKATLYSMQTLSGVPEGELFPNPPEGVVQVDEEEPLRYRTNPMKVYLDERYAIFSVSSLHIGGLYGLGFLLVVFALLGGAAQSLWRRVDWAGLRQQVREWALAGGREQVLPQIGHWLLLLMPLWLFVLFWITIPQSSEVGIFEALGIASDEPLHILDLKNTFNLTEESLIDEPSIQLAASFLIVVAGIFTTRRARLKDYGFGYVRRVGICAAAIILLALVALWRMEAHKVTFFAPSFDFLGLQGHDYSLISAFLVIIALLIYVIRANRNAERFEFIFAATLAVALVLMAPLYMDQYQSFIMGRVGLAVMFGLGLHIVIGYAGLLDLGYVAFYAIGAYTFAFLALENNRSKISAEHLNDIGWLLVSGLILAPPLLFGLAVFFQRRRAASQKPQEFHPRIRHQSRVWEDQPPWYVTLGMVVLAVAVVFGVERLLTRTGILHASQFSSFLIALFVAMMLAAFTGILLGVPVLRLRGDYLAIVTLGFGEIIGLALRNLENITGGPKGAIGVPKPVPPTTPLTITNLTLLYLSMIGAVIIILVTLRLRNSRLGRAWLAMSSDEDVAQAMGINLVNVKLLAFSIGASFAGLAGMMFASRQNSIFPEDFGLEVSINVLALVIIGGMGSVPGVVVGSIALVGLPELLRPVADYRIMLFGLLLIAAMVILPRGLMPSPPPALEEQARRLAEEEARTTQEESA